MTDLLEQGATWLAEQRTEFASRPVVYRRAAESVTLSATLGATTHEFEEVGGVLEQFTSRDFIVRASDLVLDGAAVTPQRNDRIEVTLNGTLSVYEVVAPTGMECWKWSDPYKQAYRIHTKEIHA